MGIRWRALIFVVALTGCQLSGGTKSVVTPQDTPVQALEPTRSVPLEPLLTSSMIPKSKATSSDFQKRCITISSPPDKMKIEGAIVFLENRGQSMLLMGEHEIQIPEQYQSINSNYHQSVSPNRNLLLYRQVTYRPDMSANLVIAASNGSIINEFSEDKYKWLPGIDWFSDEYLRYPVKSIDDEEQLDLFALQVSTGEVQKLRTSFPDMVDGNLIDWGIDTWSIYFGIKKGVNVIYDPSLELAVYPKMRDDYPKEGQRIYLTSLYDVQNDVELTEIHLPGSSQPAWSPDGQYFTIIGQDPITYSSDIYIISRTGDVFTPITNLAKQYPRSAFGTYSWSADSQYIAFWFKEVEQEISDNDYSLMLFDRATLEITDLCIKGNSVSAPLGYNSSFNLRGKPIWSPDGRILLITQYDPSTQDAIDLLIDLKNKIAYQIATNLEPVGWMK